MWGVCVGEGDAVFCSISVSRILHLDCCSNLLGGGEVITGTWDCHTSRPGEAAFGTDVVSHSHIIVPRLKNCFRPYSCMVFYGCELCRVASFVACLKVCTQTGGICVLPEESLVWLRLAQEMYLSVLSN